MGKKMWEVKGDLPGKELREPGRSWVVSVYCSYVGCRVEKKISSLEEADEGVSLGRVDVDEGGRSSPLCPHELSLQGNSLSRQSAW